jgi:hypothetical protein
VPDSRRGSHFCAPCGKHYFKNVVDVIPAGPRSHTTQEQGYLQVNNLRIPIERTVVKTKYDRDRLKDAILYACYGHTDPTRVREHRRNKGQGQSFRYRNLNLHSWFYRHTLEWRLPEGTIDPNAIIMWGVVLAGVMDLASKLSEKQVVELIQQEMAPLTNDATVARNLSINFLKLVAPHEAAREWIENRVRRFAQSVHHNMGTTWLRFDRVTT